MVEQELETLTGYFTWTLFKTENYMVSKFKYNQGIIVTNGPSFDFDKNQKYILNGSFFDHPKYGKQFKIITIEKYLPTKKEEIINFFTSKAFKGIGKKAATKIYETFNDSCINILKEDIQRIYECKLTSKQYEAIIEGFKDLDNPENEIIFHLISHGFSNNDAQRIFNHFKLNTLDISKTNPFKFYNDVYGISFNQVKDYAKTREFEDKELKFKEAYLIYYLKEYCFMSGDLYIAYEQLLDNLNKMGAMADFDKVLEIAINDHYLIKDEEKIYLYEDYQDEKFIAYYLINMKSDLLIDENLIEEAIINNENDLKIKYADKQKAAIKNFFLNNISLVVGGPGTGKTTIVKAMVEIFKASFPYHNLMVIAPTGRAAKRISEICDVETKTIHSLLHWNKEDNTFIFNEENPIMYDALIIDEFSMVDNNLFANLLKASFKVKKICLIGDYNQLPSIRPGYLLNDLLESNLFKATYLDINYRQKQGNEIIQLANDIINKDVDFSRFHKDIKFIDLKKEAFDLISAIKNDLQAGYDLDDIQVLAPMYKGQWGIDNLNLMLQDAFNPHNAKLKEKQVASFVFRENDKVLQLKNRPNDDVYNGDIGKLVEIDLLEKNILVNFNNIYVYYNYEELVDLSLAYSLSVHKAQGSEYPIVYFIFSKQNIRMLNKKLIYTAISRAKVKLVIVGEISLFMQGLNANLRRRNTSLKMRLLRQ